MKWLLGMVAILIVGTQAVWTAMMIHLYWPLIPAAFAIGVIAFLALNRPNAPR